MNSTASVSTLQIAADSLAHSDPMLAPIIAKFGLPTFRPHRNYYQELVDSIISQQLSVSAARAIENRFRDLFKGSFPTAEQILATDVETLRGLGLSRAKANYVLDLAQHVTDGTVHFDHLDTLSNEAIVTELTAVKGIGEWTVHMFLMFCMGRLDILPTGDLGIRNGVGKLYELGTSATPAQVVEISKRYHWHPYESAASWYIWQSLAKAPAL